MPRRQVKEAREIMMKSAREVANAAARRTEETQKRSEAVERPESTLETVDGDPGVQIEMHIFVGSKGSWDHIGGSAPQHFEPDRLTTFQLCRVPDVPRN
jgi:hypothetical protein